MVGVRLHQARVGRCQGAEGASLEVQDIAIDDALLGAAASGPFGLGEEELAGIAEGQGQRPGPGDQAGAAVQGERPGGGVEVEGPACSWSEVRPTVKSSVPEG